MVNRSATQNYAISHYVTDDMDRIRIVVFSHDNNETALLFLLFSEFKLVCIEFKLVGSCNCELCHVRSQTLISFSFYLIIGN